MFHAAPYALLRHNLLPSRRIADNPERLATTLWELSALRSEREVCRAAMDADLHHRVSIASGPERKELIALRRDLRAGRPWASSTRAADGLAETLRWHEVENRIASIEAILADRYEGSVRAERMVLAGLLADDDLRKSLAMSSEWLPGSALRYARHAETGLPKRARKAEESLLRFALRAAHKTSPLTRYTATAFVLWSGDAAESMDDVRLDARGTMSLNRGLIRAVEQAVAREPDGVLVSRLRPNPTLVEREHGYQVTVRGSLLGHTDARATAAFDVRIPHGALMTGLLAWFGTRHGASASIGEFASLFAAGEEDFGRVADVLVRLVRRGVLVADAAAESAEPNGWLPWARAVAAAVDGPVRRAGAALVDAHDVLLEYPAASAERRVEIGRAVTAHVDRSVRSLGVPAVADALFYEDVADPEVRRLRPEGLAETIGAIRRLVDTVHIFDEQHVLGRIYTRRLVEKLGPGFVSTDWVLLGDVFVEALHDALLVAAGRAEDIGTMRDPRLGELVELRESILAAVGERVLASDGGDVEIGDDVMARVATSTPSWLHRHPASYSVFWQPLRNSGSVVAVTNKIYNGWGNFLSRYVSLFGPEARHSVEDMIERSRLPGEVVAEFRAVNGFSGNVHPCLTPMEIETGGRRTASSIGMDELVVVHDRIEDEVRLTRRGAPGSVRALYLGFLVPYYLPRRLAILTALGGSGAVLFEPHAVADRIASPSPDQVRCYPRVTIGGVAVTRRRWRVPAALLPAQRHDERPGQYHTRLNLWRLDHGIPEHVYLHPPAPELGDSSAEGTGMDEYFGAYLTNRKPQALDFLSALQVSHLKKLTSKLPGPVIEIEEALPAHGTSHLNQGRENAVEFVSEFYRGGRHRGGPSRGGADVR
ncbi:MAG: hypothetical protein ACRCYX_10685 [Dermatophilaceae bacterium]